MNMNGRGEYSMLPLYLDLESMYVYETDEKIFMYHGTRRSVRIWCCVLFLFLIDTMNEKGISI